MWVNGCAVGKWLWGGGLVGCVGEWVGPMGGHGGACGVTGMGGRNCSARTSLQGFDTGKVPNRLQDLDLSSGLVTWWVGTGGLYR